MMNQGGQRVDGVDGADFSIGQSTPEMSQRWKKDHQMPQEQKNMKMPKELCR